MPSVDLVDMYLRLAEKYNMKFYFGLYDSGRYWDTGDLSWEIEDNKYVIDEVWKMYGEKYKSFGGWYISAEDYEIEVMYRRLLENSLILSQRKADFLRFETANERYARLLKEHPEIVQRAPLSHIASYLLMTPETLSRVRANMQL